MTEEVDENEVDENDVDETSLPDLIERWCNKKKYYHFEMERGVQRFEDLIRVLGYSSVQEFLVDNPGALQVLIEWIGDQNLNDWIEKFKEEK